MDLRTAGVIFSVLGTIYVCRAANVYHLEQDKMVLQAEKQKQDEERRQEFIQQHNHHHQNTQESVRFFYYL